MADEGDLKRLGEEIDGNASDDSFVLVNDNSDDSAEENSDSCLEKGNGNVEGVEGSGIELQSELDLGREEVGDRELYLKDGDVESGVSDAGNGECCEEKGRGDSCPDEPEIVSAESVVEVEGEKEYQHVESGSSVDVGEKLDCETAVGEANQQGEFESVGDVEGIQDLEAVVMVAKHHEESESIVAETREPLELESATEVGEEQKYETVVMETDPQRESESAVRDNQEPQVTIAEASWLAGLEHALELEEEQKFEAVVAEDDQQGEFESAVDVEGSRDPEVVVTGAKHEEEFESTVEKKQEAELESALEVEEEHKSESVVMETDHQRGPESAAPENQEPQAMVGGATLPAGLEDALEVQEEQKFETVVAEADPQREPEASVEAEGKRKLEILVIETDNLADQSDVIVEEGKSETIEVVEKEEAQITVKEDDEQAEPESAKVEEEHQAFNARRAHDQEESDVHVEEKTEVEIGLGNTEGTDELKSFVEVEARQQSNIEVKEIDIQGELKSAVEVEMEQQPETLVSERKALEVVGSQEPVNVIEEPSDQLEVVSEVKPKTILELDDENGSPETAEIISAAEPVGNGGSKPANQVDMHLGDEVTASPFESSDHTRLHDVDDKEIEGEDSVRREIVVTNNTEHEGDVCKSITDCKKDIAVVNDGEMNLEHNMNDGEGDQDMRKDDGEVSTLEQVDASETIQIPDEPNAPALDGERLGTHAVKRQHCYIIRVPRFSNDDLRTKLQHARLQLDEKTQRRDSARVEIQKKRATLNGYREKLEAAKSVERAARAAVNAKRQEIDSVQSMINMMKNASSIDEINDKIHNTEHTMQHESITLTLEKQYIREVKHLRHQREQISANMGPQAEIQEVFDRRDQIEEQFKTLKKELDSLRTTVLRAESDVNADRKKCDDEFQLLKDLQEQFRVADKHRQEAYVHVLHLRNESNEKIKYFNMYRDDLRTAMNYVSAGEKEALRSHCSEQVEKIMDLWNKDEEFREQYVKFNVNSTLRRLRTLDGRSLGSDEEPPILLNNYNRSSIKDPLPIPNDDVKEDITAATVAPVPVVQKDQLAKPKKLATSRGTIEETVSNTEEVKEAERKITRTKEEEELARKAEESARKAEELRKEKAATELKEKQRMEQIAKAKEAEIRKKRKAEKAQAIAEFKAQKEAELREKRRAKREKKKAELADTTNGVGEVDAVAIDTALPKMTKEPEMVVRAAPRRSARPPAIVKQYNKTEPLPLPLRNKGRRKMQTWMWVLLTTLVVFMLFLAGNYVSNLR